MIKRRFYLKTALISLVIFCFSFSTSVFAAEKFRVSAQVFHLGEMIAQPVLDVVADKTLGGDYYTPEETRYRFVVLVRPMDEEKVSVSLQFSSGKINIQPNLLMDLGEETTATIDKVLLKLVVTRIPEQGSSGIVAP